MVTVRSHEDCTDIHDPYHPWHHLILDEPTQARGVPIVLDDGWTLHPLSHGLNGVVGYWMASE